MYRLEMISVGRSEIPGPELFWMREWDKWFELCFQVALIRGRGRVVLVNTGPAEDLGPMNAQWESFLGPRAAMRREPGEFIVDALEARGVHSGDVTDVILTPFQLYSVSNVARFPNAQIHLSKRGWLHFHTTHAHPHDDRESSLPPDVLNYLVGSAWPRVRLLNDEDEVVEGIRTWWAGCHHRASIVVEVDTELGVAAISDAYFYLENVKMPHPIGIAENIYEAGTCYERVSRVADVVLPLYDPKNLERFANGVVTGG